MSDNEQSEFAIQQLIGFNHAKKGYDIVELCTSMGLKKREWLKIRKDVSVWLCAQDVKDVNEYFLVNK